MPFPAQRIPWFLVVAALAGGAKAVAEGDGHPMAGGGGGWYSVPAPGHSVHGEAFNEGPRGAAVLMAGMPRVHFPVTSTNPAVQPFFDQGVGQLHGFWYFEAERSFRQVALLDPNCAMAYWGMAMANVNNAGRSRDFITRAVALEAGATARERAWIDALAGYRREKDGDKERSEKDRRREYIRALESLVQDHPNDVEARAFLSYQVWDNAGFGNEKPLAITSHQTVDALLESVFVLSPMHPAHHYRIHLWDSEKPVRALGSAARGGPSGPGIAHLWHMPGHTYDKFQRYADAAWQQEASARVDHAHMARARILPDQIHNYAHNQEWLSRSLSHLGRVRDSLAVAANLAELPRHPVLNHPGKGGSTSAYGRLRLATTLLRWEQWDRAIAETTEPGGHLESTTNREHAALRLFTQGFARLMKEGTNAVTESLAGLEQLRADVARDRFQAAEEAEARGRKANKSRSDIGREMAEALQGYDKEIVPLEEAAAELRAWLAAFREDTNEVRELLSQVRAAPKTRLAYAWLRAGDAEQAVRLAREAAEKSTNQLHELAVRCDVLWQAGKTNEAREAFAAVRAASSFAETNLPVLVRLAPVAESLGIAGDWRAPYSPPSDVGYRPSLDTLGPRFWEPYAAPKWQFVDGTGKTVTAEEFHGRAHLLLFYLGHGCAHCIEQLKAFGPLADEFRKAGLEILAVSLDEPKELPWTARRAGTDGRMEFPVLSDESRKGFRAFRAYDDFEDVPLHGAFLVDFAGNVRWQDIGHEPFTDAKFLLGEAKRLLGSAKAFAVAAPSK